MKILVITEDSSLTGGTTTFVQEVTKHLARKGHQVYLIEGSSNPSFKKKEVVNKVKIYRYFVHPKTIFQLNLSMCYQTIKITKYLLKKIKFDVLYLHLYSPPFAIFLTNIAPKTPKILHFHGARYLEILSTLGKPKKHKILGMTIRIMNYGPSKIFWQRFVQTFSLKKAAKIIVLSQYSKELVINKFHVSSQKIIVIPPGVDEKIFHLLTPKEKTIKRRQLGFDKNINILLIASRIEARKGIIKAIKAMPKVLSYHPNTILLIASPAKSCVDHQLLSQYYNLVSKFKLGSKIFFSTGLSKEKLASFYQIADCFLMVSEDLETFGLTTIESLSCGTPVLGTPVGATPEILTPVEKNLILKDVTHQAIAKGAIWFLSLSSIKKRRLSQKSVNHIKTYYFWRKNINILGKIMKSLC